LEAVHSAIQIALGHFLVDDSAACGHPLNVTSSDGATIPNAIAVLNRSGKDIGDRLNAAVGMPRETRQVILRDVITEIVQQEKWVKIGWGERR